MPTVIHLIPSCHADFAWGHRRSWHERRYALVIRDVLEIMRINPKFHWFLETYAEELRPFLDKEPALVPEFIRRVCQGRIEICGCISNPILNQVGGETLIRNITLGRKFFAPFLGRQNAEVYTAIDLFPGYSQIPQILRLGGFKYFRCSRPMLARVGEFVWRGIDGTAILCSQGGYDGSPLSQSKIYLEYKQNREKAKKTIIEYIHKDSKHPAGIVWYPFGGDDRRPLKDYDGTTDLELFDFLDSWRRKENVPLKISTPGCFFRDLETRIKKLPVLCGELHWSGCTPRFGLYGNNNVNVFWPRIEDKLITLEILHCLPTLGRPARPGSACKTDAYWIELLATTGHANNFSFKADYHRLLKKLKKLEQNCDRAIDKQFKQITVKTGNSHEQKITIFNPLSWEREDVVQIPRPMRMKNSAGFHVVDSDGKPAPVQIDKRQLNGSEAGQTIIFQARVPAFGFKTYQVIPRYEAQARLSDFPRAKETYLKVDDGVITSLKINDQGTELAGKRGLAVKYYSIDPSVVCYGGCDTNGPFEGGGVWRVNKTRLESGPLYHAYSASGELAGHKVEHKIIHYHTLPRIEFITTIDSMGGDGYLTFEINPSFDGRVKAQAPFAVEKRTGSFAALGPGEDSIHCPGRFFADRWIDYASEQFGICLIGARGYEGYAFDKKRRRLHHFLLKNRSLETQGSRPWLTKLSPLHTGRGKHRFRYALAPHPGNWGTDQLHRKALEYHFPFLVLNAREIRAVYAKPFVEIRPANVFISAMRFVSARVMEIRLYEMLGRESEVEIFLNHGAGKATKVDFHGTERRDEKIIQSNGRLAFRMKPWEIATFRIHFKL